MKTYNCLHCKKESTWGHSKTNKFCSNACQGLFKWVNETKPEIIAGKRRNPWALKKFLVEEVGDYCAECGQKSIWNNKPLVLQLDHMDGNSDNNSLTNLRLLCPNCHTQTSTFGSKGQGNRYQKTTKRNQYLQKYKASLV